MANPARDAVLLCFLVISAHALQLPSLERKAQREHEQFLERHSHLLSTERPQPAEDTQPGSLDRGLTAPPARPADDARPQAESEPEPGKEPAKESEPEKEPAKEPEVVPEPEQEQEAEPKSEPEPNLNISDGSSEQKSQPAVPAEKQGVEGKAVPVEPSNRQTAPQIQQVDQPSVISSDQANDIGADETTVTPVFEAVPDNAYAVFDHTGRICILATLSADLEIFYYTEYDERKTVKVRLPDDAKVTGACARDDAKPQINFLWDNFEFSMLFKENDIGNTWYVSDMKLEYDGAGDRFPEAKPNVGRQMLWMDQQMQHTLHLFGTPVDKAYFCTSKQDLDLYNRDGRRSATVVLWDLHLQPYVRNGQFGASVNCPGVPVGRRRINETVPLAVGSTLATVTILTIAGYAVWRHFKVKKFNYDTME